MFLLLVYINIFDFYILILQTATLLLFSIAYIMFVDSFGFLCKQLYHMLITMVLLVIFNPYNCYFSPCLIVLARASILYWIRVFIQNIHILSLNLNGILPEFPNLGWCLLYGFSFLFLLWVTPFIRLIKFSSISVI